jgi:uncharacterized damage-inducible protein DinB
METTTVTRLRGTILRTLLVCLLAPAAVAFAQEPTPAPAPRPMFTLPKENPLTAWNKLMYTQLQMIVLRAAEKMPEENYSFKPTEAVRSYGQILGHVADANYFFCSTAIGEKSPGLKIEETKTTKADLIASLKGAFAYCNKAYEGMTDASGTEPVKFMGMDAPKLGVMIVNSSHTVEHYGNLVTYMRLKNILPPTSEPGMPGAPKKQ